jgi:hypothetical protein
LRLWAAEMAFATNVPRDLRKYIGQWSQETTADTYTREHGLIITQIWDHIWAGYDQAQDKTRETPQVEPTHQDYIGESPHPPTFKRIRCLTTTQGTEEQLPCPPTKTPPTETGNDTSGQNTLGMASDIPTMICLPLPQVSDDFAEESSTPPSGSNEHPTPWIDTTIAEDIPVITDTMLLAQVLSKRRKLLPTAKPKSQMARERSASPPSSDDDFYTGPQLPDIYSHAEGPLTVVRSKKRIKDKQQPHGRGHFKIHFLKPDRVTIGCNKTLQPRNYSEISNQLDYMTATDTEECKHCRTHARIPSSWNTTVTKVCQATEATGPDSTSSSDSDSSTSVETKKRITLDTSKAATRPSDTA